VVPSQRLALFASLAMSVFGLVLVERLFRNVSPDFRWSIKPCVSGLVVFSCSTCTCTRTPAVQPD
jgi:hypothetical protein